MNKKSQIQGNIILLITALIWGTAFVAQSSGMEHVPPLTFNALRSFLAVITLAIFILIRNKVTKKSENKLAKKIFCKAVLLPGVLCGIALTIATNFQQFGILYTTVGKAGFITSLYIIFVPIIGMFMGKKVKLNIWISVIISLVGFYLLCVNKTDFSIELGDILVFIGALFFAIQILIVDHYGSQIDGALLSCLQFLVVFVITIIPALIIERPSIEGISGGLGSIIYAGVLSSGVAYTIQIIGQKKVQPVVASLILSLESVIAAIAGVIILHETFLPREIIGCIILFGAVILSQIPFKDKKNKQKEEEIVDEQI